METTAHKTINRTAPTLQPASARQQLSPRVGTSRGGLQVQRATKVSSASDPAEKEADSTAQKVMRMAVSEGAVTYRKTARGGVFRQVAPDEKMVQPKLQSPYLTRFAGTGLFKQAAPEEEVQRQAAPEEDTIQRQAEPEKLQKQAMEEPDTVQTKLQAPYLARFAGTGLFKQAAPEEETVQRQAAPEEEVQRQAAPEEEMVQRQPEPEMVQKQAMEESDPVQAKLRSPARFAPKALLRQAAPEEETMQRQAVPEEDVQRQAAPEEETMQRQVATEEKDTIQTQVEQKEENTVQRKADNQSHLTENVAADIKGSMASGTPLPVGVRRFMEPRFQADFGNVKIHADDNAAKLNKQVNAQAFAMGNHIFFGKDKFQPETDEGKELIAHELTHTIQQGGAEQGDNSQGNDTAQRREAVTVTQQSSTHVQRLGISDALDYFAERAYNIPGFRMFTIVIGVNPINMSPADRSAANILRAIVEFLPGGNLITRALDNYGVFEKAGAWIEQQIDSLGITGSSIRDAVMDFLDSLGWSDIFDLSGVWQRAKRIFTDPIGRIINLVKSIGGAILDFIRDAILRPLAGLAEGTRGWDLLQAVLGFNPITGDSYPQNADTLIGGFMKLIGQEEVWENIKKANAVARAWDWFQTALAGLLSFVSSIPDRFMQVLRSLTIQDLVILPQAFAKVGRAFLGFVGQFISWAGSQVMSLLQIIFEVVAPGLMPYIRRTASVFQTIIRNPIGFVRNLVRAGVKGLRQFAGNFLTHLRASLIGWLTGAMSGANIYIPQGFNLREILKFVLSVLGITWQNIRQKLVRVIGEPAVAALETGFELVRTLITEGPAAAWEQILEGLTNLREMVMEQIMSFVQVRVVQAAITRLVTSLNPAGAFIQAIIATYNTIMFFVERMRQIIQVARSIIDSIVAIATGVIQPAADRVEQTMAGMLTLVISFLARIAGLGRVSDAVTRIINRIRQPIDRALDRVVAWIVRQARRLGQAIVGGVRGAAQRILTWWRERRSVRLADGRQHSLSFRRSGQNTTLILASTPRPIEDHLNDVISNNEFDTTTKTQARNALQFYQTHIYPITRQPVPNNPPAALQTLINNLPQNLNRLSQLLMQIGQGSIGDLPNSARWRFSSNPKAAHVDLLSFRTSRGGTPARSGQPDGWPLITSMGLTRSNGNWVRMHLITAAVGGHDTARNLLPTPTAVNTGGAVRGFETRVEQLIYGDQNPRDRRTQASIFRQLNTPTVIWISVQTTGFHPAYTDPATGNQLYDATTFATGVDMKAGLYYFRQSQWTKDSTPQITAVVNSIDPPDLTGTYVPNFNSVGSTIMMRQTEISRHFADEIIRERGGTPAQSPYNSTLHFINRMFAYRRNNGINITDEFRNAISQVSTASIQNKIKWRS